MKNLVTFNHEDNMEGTFNFTHKMPTYRPHFKLTFMVLEMSSHGLFAILQKQQFANLACHISVSVYAEAPEIFSITTIKYCIISLKYEIAICLYNASSVHSASLLPHFLMLQRYSKMKEIHDNMKEVCLKSLQTHF